MNIRVESHNYLALSIGHDVLKVGSLHLLLLTSSRTSPSTCSTPPYFWSSSSLSRTSPVAGDPSVVAGALPPVADRSSVLARAVAPTPRVIFIADWKLLYSDFSVVDGGNQLDDAGWSILGVKEVSDNG
ncbi:hypothetical protein PIB30_080872 [Stylosanthes scabra]|uniref:Uncharacterized protein n=1 Tax=Stylosanthes scabra TaxID=79078 RepID=A0ABU6TSU7_9FABA|nr:hypothetical protein [Stylosanthes scabra]